MRDPDLVDRAQRAATGLELAWHRWRSMHGLAADPLPPVSSYVGYSLEEPWGQPRVVFGVDAEEAEQLAAVLDGHDCIGPAAGRSAGRAGVMRDAAPDRPAAPADWPAPERAADAGLVRIPAQAAASEQADLAELGVADRALAGHGMESSRGSALGTGPGNAAAAVSPDAGRPDNAGRPDTGGPDTGRPLAPELAAGPEAGPRPEMTAGAQHDGEHDHAERGGAMTVVTQTADRATASTDAASADTVSADTVSAETSITVTAASAETADGQVAGTQAAETEAGHDETAVPEHVDTVRGDGDGGRSGGSGPAVVVFRQRSELATYLNSRPMPGPVPDVPAAGELGPDEQSRHWRLGRGRLSRGRRSGGQEDRGAIRVAGQPAVPGSSAHDHANGESSMSVDVAGWTAGELPGQVADHDGAV